MLRNKESFTAREKPVPWSVGEHVAIIGTTGTGKTYLTARLLEQRRYVVVIRTKPDDIKFDGFKKVKDARMMDGMKETKLLVVPEFSQQRRVAAEVMQNAWEMGGWTVVIDELFYVHDMLKLKPFVDMLMTQGRSKNLSIVVGMQRPVHVTRFALSEASHIFSFRLEGRDQKTVRDMASDAFSYATGKVPPFHFAHWHVKSRSVGVGTADHLGKILVGAGGV